MRRRWYGAIASASDRCSATWMPAPMDDGSGTTSVSKSLSDSSNATRGRPPAASLDSVSSNDCWAAGDSVDAMPAQRRSS